jgi:hypothetical protein
LPKKPWRKRRKSGLIHRVEIRAKERISILTDPEGKARESSMLLPSPIFAAALRKWKSNAIMGGNFKRKIKYEGADRGAGLQE